MSAKLLKSGGGQEKKSPSMAVGGAPLEAAAAVRAQHAERAVDVVVELAKRVGGHVEAEQAAVDARRVRARATPPSSTRRRRRR